MHPPRICRGLLALAASACVALAGCLEHKERIVVAEDGSVQLTVLAKGSARDLADGAMVPLGVGWTRQGKDTAAWSELFGTSGRKAVLDESLWKDEYGLSRTDVEIGGSAAFSSVSGLPRTYASITEPYHEAEPHFSTKLEVRHEIGRRVYVFERTYRGLPGSIYRIWKQFVRPDADTPEDFVDRIWGGRPFSQEEKESVARRVSDALIGIADTLAREAVAAHYLEGSGVLPMASRTKVLSDAHAAAARFATVARIVAVLDAERASVGSPGHAGPLTSSPLVAMDQAFREVLRTVLRVSLEKAGIEADEVNGVLGALELELAGADRAQDLSDDSFKVELTLPGTIVGGNFDEVDGGTARFKFSGSELAGRDVVLRATSVLEESRR